MVLFDHALTMRRAILGLLLCGGCIVGTAAAGELFAEARIAAAGAGQWTFALSDGGRPPLDPATVGTRQYLSSGNRADTYPEAGATTLRFRVRSEAAALAGMLACLEVRVNGRPLTVSDLLNRPPRFTLRNGTVVETARKDSQFLVYHAPDFSRLPEDYKYLPIGLPDQDPFVYEFGISAHVVTGANVVEIRNTRSPDAATALVVVEGRVDELSEDERLLEPSRQQSELAARYRAAAARLEARMPTLPDSPRMQDLLGDMRMASWGSANSSPMTEYDRPEEARANARRIRDDGATVAIVRGRHFRLDHLDETARLMAFYKLTADACREAGLLPFAHLDFTLFWQPGYAIVSQHPDWPQVALGDGTPHHWCCTNNPSFREAHIRYVEEICRQGMVGFMLDEINFAHVGKYYCGCRHCREGFEEATGFRFPEHDAADIIGNSREPLWRLWLEWQHTSITEFKSELVQRLRKVNPDAVVLTYSTNIYGPARTGNTFEEGRVCFSGTEGTNRVYGQFANQYATHRIADGFSRRWGKPAWAQYPVADDAEKAWASAFFAAVVNNKPWGWRSHSEGEALRDTLAWPHLAECMAFAEPVANLAVLLGTPNRWGPPLEASVHQAEVFGLCQAMGLRGVQFDPVPGLHLEPGRLDAFSAALIGYSPAMPLATVDLVHDWVQRGGTAVVTGLAGRYDRFGFALGEYSLIRRAGLRGVHRRDPMVFNRYQGKPEGLRAQVIDLAAGVMPELPRQVAVPPTYR
ncbi:MAG: hypothetical protein GX595_06540, partial [Lentisphaerae bacterium]|nr:hypothetical protein [Lentisphaerota bacterium]